MVRPLATQENLAERAYKEILSAIVSGRLPELARLVQDDLANDLGVSRHPVQQALLLLRKQGLVREAAGRGLEVAPIELEFVRDLYELRAVAEGLAGRLAASRGSALAAKLGPKLIEDGRKAEREGSIAKLIEADVKFHELLYNLSGNVLIKDMMQPHWLHLRRLMAEVLANNETPRRIWEQHQNIIEAVISGDERRAEELARSHINDAAADYLVRFEKLRSDPKVDRV